MIQAIDKVVSTQGRSGDALLGERRRMKSRDLLGDDSELIISHGAEEYRLRVTRQGKLILTK